MIDTDKYEGHAKEGWHFDSAHVLRDGYDKEIAELVGEDWLDDKATQELIADAPLLLAEVERLRRELESIENNMAWTVQVWQNENYMGRQDWMEQMCEIYADLAKGVEAQYYGDEEE